MKALLPSRSPLLTSCSKCMHTILAPSTSTFLEKYTPSPYPPPPPIFRLTKFFSPSTYWLLGLVPSYITGIVGSDLPSSVVVDSSGFYPIALPTNTPEIKDFIAAATTLLSTLSLVSMLVPTSSYVLKLIHFYNTAVIYCELPIYLCPYNNPINTTAIITFLPHPTLTPRTKVP